jgi:hypothetical protein
VLFVAIFAAVVVLLVGLLVVGLRVQPRAFAAPGAGATGAGAPGSGALPAPVARFFQVSCGDRLPIITSAILSGRGSLRLGPIRFPARYRFTHQAGQGYRHYIETTFFGRPLFRVNEWYLDGQCRMELPVGVIADDEKTNAGANLALWGESVFLSPLFLTDARLRWEPVDATHARLVVTGGDGFDVTFDEATGLISSMAAPRWKKPTDTAKTLWRIDLGDWRRFSDVMVPASWALTWADEAGPWFSGTLEEAVYNADVTEYIKATGP